MKTKTFLLIVGLHFAFCILPSEAQIPAANDSGRNYIDLYHQISSKTFPGGIIRNPDYTFSNPNSYPVFLINDQILLSKPFIHPDEKSGTVKGYGIGITLDNKWKELTGKPLVDTTKVYYSPVKRTPSPSFTDSRLYRTLGNGFNFIMDATYPSRTAHK